MAEVKFRVSTHNPFTPCGTFPASAPHLTPSGTAQGVDVLQPFSRGSLPTCFPHCGGHLSTIFTPVHAGPGGHPTLPQASLISFRDLIPVEIPEQDAENDDTGQQ